MEYFSGTAVHPLCKEYIWKNEQNLPNICEMYLCLLFDATVNELVSLLF